MTLSDIRTRALTRIEEDPDDPAWQFAATAAINEGLRIFVYLTLCLENEREFALTPGTQFYNMLPAWPDWILPLRVRISNSTAASYQARFNQQPGNLAQFNNQGAAPIPITATPKLRPQNLYEMASLDPNFLNNAGIPTRYGSIGCDLFYVNSNPGQAGIKLQVTYARMCLPLVQDTDVPEILEPDHPSLVSYAIARLRANEGGLELSNAAPLLAEYLACVKARKAIVQTRGIEQGYNIPVWELKVKGKP